MGHDRAPLADKIRRRLDAGELPREHAPKLLSRFGKGETCSVCDQTIYRAEVLYEFEWTDNTDTTYQVHTRCYSLWTGELIRRGLYTPE
jgi:hypothetical protein